MSRQIGIYALPSDVDRLLEEFKEAGDYRILHSYSTTSSPRVLSSMNLEENGHRWLFFGLTPAAHLSAITMNHVPKQERWSVDPLLSPVIEFTASFFDGETLRMGRMYYTETFYDAGDQLQSKPEDFRSWSKAIFNIARKRLRKEGRGYIGPDADQWLATNSKAKLDSGQSPGS